MDVVRLAATGFIACLAAATPAAAVPLVPAVPLVTAVSLAAPVAAPPAAATVPAPAPPRVAGPRPHSGSLSFTRLAVDGRVIEQELQMQVASLLAVLDIDLDDDGLLSAEELAAGRGVLDAYVRAHYVLRVDSGGDPAAGRVPPGELLDLRAWTRFEGRITPEPWVTGRWRHRDVAPVRDLLVEMTLFLDADPDHRDVTELVWNGASLPVVVFSARDTLRRYAPEVPSAPAGAAADRPLPLWLGSVALMVFGGLVIAAAVRSRHRAGRHIDSGRHPAS